MLETEVKIEIDRERKVKEIYEAIGRPSWDVQRNYLFAFGESFLRIRHEAGKAFLTSKGKDSGGVYNQRPEIECEIPTEFFMGFSKLAGLNGNPRYYEKSRASAEFMGCQVCLDNFSGTHYLEVEGQERDITKVIEKFGLQEFPIEKRSYLELLGCEDGQKRKN